MRHLHTLPDGSISLHVTRRGEFRIDFTKAAYKMPGGFCGIIYATSQLTSGNRPMYPRETDWNEHRNESNISVGDFALSETRRLVNYLIRGGATMTRLLSNFPHAFKPRQIIWRWEDPRASRERMANAMEQTTGAIIAAQEAGDQLAEQARMAAASWDALNIRMRGERRDYTRLTFGQRLRLIRGSRNMTQRDLAQRGQCSTSSIYNWETGRREPSWTSMYYLQRALNTTSQFLRSGVGDLTPVAYN